MMQTYNVFKVMGGLTASPWLQKLGTVEASSHAEAMQAAFEKFNRNYDGLAVVMERKA